LKKIIKLRLDIEVALTNFDCVLKKKLKIRTNAKSILLNYRSIDLNDENIEDNVF